MSDKPTTLPRWANGGGAKVATPSSGKQDIGWDTQEKPPAQWFNWLLLNIYLWLLWISDGYLTRNDLTTDAPVQGTTDQDANVKHWLDANGYNFGQVISAQYWWVASNNFTAADQVSNGDRFHLTIEEAGLSASAEPAPSSVLGCYMLKVNVVSSPTSLNGLIFSCDDGSISGNNDVFTNLNDAIAVMETHVMTDQTTNNPATIYIGFHEVAGSPDLLEDNLYPCACLVLDYGETVFEGMTSDGTTNSKSTTGETCSTNTLYHVRVEYHGANTPHGVDNSGAVARFFIDGDLVLEKTTNPPQNGDWLGPMLAVRAAGTGNSTDINFGPVQWSVNYLASSQVPTV